MHSLPPLSRRQTLLGAAALTLSGLAQTSQSQEKSTTTTASAPVPVPKRIVFVVSNEVSPGPAGFPIGYYLTELAHPYWAFQQRGYIMDVASPNGGRVVHDAMSDPEGGRFGPPQDFLSIGFKHSPKVKPLLENTKKLSDVKVADYDAIFVIGGLGPMVTFTDNTELHKLFASFYEAGKVSATICHGSVILLKTRLTNGKLLAEGKQWTGFCDAEEEIVDKAYSKQVQPFRIETEARKIANTRFIQGPPYKPFAVRDGLLISGQQGSSGGRTGELVIQALES
ncbi:type 1 glutamine amidotransferase domain-containing protein [soil metagenome]